MATLTQLASPALPAQARKYSMQKVERRPPVHIEPGDSFVRISFGDNQDVYIGEGLIDPSGVDHLRDDHRRSLLDSLAVEVGEKYLDDIYKEDDGNNAGFYKDGPQPTRYHSASNQKELALQKVRQHLIEEEEKKPRAQSMAGSEEGSDVGAVRLLDLLASPGMEDMYSSSSASSGVSGPDVNYVPQTFASRIDRIGNKLVQLLQRKQVTDDETSTTSSLVSQSSSQGGNQSTHWLLASLGQLTKTCQRTELSESSIARISAHLAAIDRIAREDITSQQKNGFRRVSNTQWSSDSSGYELREPRIPMLEHRQGNVAPTVRNSFKAFIAAQDLCDTLAAFNNLLTDCGLNGAKMNEPWHLYYHVRAVVYYNLGFRQKQLFRLLDARFNLDVYKQRPTTNKSVCVVGAGPVGLRAAVELALLGGNVSILEKRTKFSRENRLHLWPWVVQDLASLGAKVLFKNFCKSRTYFHVSTRQLQVILLKVALLVGVKVYSATGFESILPPQMNGGRGKPFYSIKTEPQVPVKEFTAVLGATGVNDQLAEPAGLNRFAFSQKESLGIVCYFPNLETPEEMKVKEFSWTAQLKHHMLHKMREIGVDLENIVYFRGEMHYLVMTPKRQNLLVRGVVKQNLPNSKDLVEGTNVSQRSLHAFIKRVVEFAGIPRRTDFTRVSLFDFSSLTRAEKPASILTSHGKKLYVGLIGDSLLEPVWHEGVGTCRGFLGALDAVWMIAQIGTNSDEQILADRDLAYRVMQRVSGHHRNELHKNVRKYDVNPRSRYTINFPQVV